MSVPYRFDDHVTERSKADGMLADLGLTQEILAARQANRGDVSVNLVGIGPQAPSQNPMAIGATPAPPHIEANPAPPPYDACASRTF